MSGSPVSVPSSIRAVRREPHAFRLAVSWMAILVVIALMVIAPFVLYLRGRTIRNRLTFEVGAMELAVERASRAMASRERALRAFLYIPERRRLEDYQAASATLEGALAAASETAASEPEPRRLAIERMMRLAADWDAASSALIARAARGERDLLSSPETARPGPMYDEFQSIAAETLASLEAEREALVVEMASADDARLVLPFVLALLGVPVMLYVGSLSRDALRLLALARAEQERLARILEHMADPVLVTDPSGVVTLANPAARTELGVSPGTTIRALEPRLLPIEPERSSREGVPTAAAVSPGDIVAAIAAARPLAAAEARVDAHAPAPARPVSVSSAPIVIDGAIAGAVTVVRDLSDRVRYEQERLQSERFLALGAIAERIAHDFGNYLEAASAAAAMLERPSAADPAKRSRWVALIRTTIEEGRHALSSLRTLSFVSHRQPRFATVALAPMIARAIDVARMARPDADVTIEQHAADGLRVDASEGDLVRAFVNVLVNAIDASPSGGRVVVAAEARGDRVRVAVSDGGGGIPAEDHERIFDMYFTTKGDRGSGMGLALAREVVHLHDGEIELESEPGAGSTFTIVLPPAGGADRDAERAAPASPAREPQPEASP